MDLEGNIYDLRGNFIGTTDDDGADGNAQVPAGINVGTHSGAGDQHQAQVEALIDDEEGEDVDYTDY
jgi:hypothetical protein